MEMATALEEAVGLLPARDVGAWVERIAHARLAERRQLLDGIEAEGSGDVAISAVHTPLTMVRVSIAPPERTTLAEPRPRPRRRFPMIAWGSAAAVVVAIGGGVGARSLVSSHAPATGPAAAPLVLSEMVVAAPVSTPEPSPAAPPAAPGSAHPPPLPVRRTKGTAGIRER